MQTNYSIVLISLAVISLVHFSLAQEYGLVL